MSKQRYNQGFGKFGPMEKCNTGEWVKVNDVLPEIADLKTAIHEHTSEARKLICDRDFYKTQMSTLETNLENYYKREDGYFRMSITLAALAFIGWSAFAVVLIRQYLGA